jgi:hypothetical protein
MLISQEQLLSDPGYLQECFNYDHLSGILTYRHRPRHHFKTYSTCQAWNKKYAETQADRLIHLRSVTTLNGLTVPTDKIVWALHHREPTRSLRHINEQHNDNRIANLTRGKAERVTFTPPEGSTITFRFQSKYQRYAIVCIPSTQEGQLTFPSFYFFYTLKKIDCYRWIKYLNSIYS